MHYIVLALLLPALVLADAQDSYSYTEPVGVGYGLSFKLVGSGQIRAIRVWDVQSSRYYYNHHYRYYGYNYYNYHNYISAIQICFDNSWSPIAGYAYGYQRYQEIVLHPGEVIIAVNGKYTHFISELVFTTNRGRSLFVGQPTGKSFNLYPVHPLAELRSLSGRFSGGITSLQTHWAFVNPPAAIGSDSANLA